MPTEDRFKNNFREIKVQLTSPDKNRGEVKN